MIVVFLLSFPAVFIGLLAPTFLLHVFGIRVVADWVEALRICAEASLVFALFFSPFATAMGLVAFRRKKTAEEFIRAALEGE